MTDTTDLIQRLRAYQQADEEGVIVKVSRQACDEAAELSALRADAERYRFLKRNGITVYFRQTQTTNRQIHCQDMDFQIDSALRQEQPT